MKNLFLSFTLLFCVNNTFAQIPDSTIWIHAELLGTQKLLSQKVDVSIDFGQSKNMFQDQRIVDPETGKPKTFNSMVDALNFMGALGWEFVQAYVVTIGNQNVYHWLLRRAVKVDEKGNYIPLTRKEYNKIKEAGN